MTQEYLAFLDSEDKDAFMLRHMEKVKEEAKTDIVWGDDGLEETKDLFEEQKGTSNFNSKPKYGVKNINLEQEAIHNTLTWVDAHSESQDKDKIKEHKIKEALQEFSIDILQATIETLEERMEAEINQIWLNYSKKINPILDLI